MAIQSVEGYLLVVICDANLIVSTRSIQVGEVMGSFNVVKKLRNEQGRTSISHGDLTQFTPVYTGSYRTYPHDDKESDSKVKHSQIKPLSRCSFM